MLYIVKSIEDWGIYEYEFDNLRHAEEQYNWEKSAEMWIYKDGEEILVKSK